MKPKESATAARLKEMPRADIRATAARVVRVSEIAPSEYSHRGSYSLNDAIVIEFTNETTRGGPGMEPLVKASLTFKDAQQRDVLQVTGGWVDQPMDVAEFRIQQTHSLLIGSLLDGQLVTTEPLSAAAEGGGKDHLKKYHPLVGLQQGAVSVSLVDIHTGRLLYDGYFEIGVKPLRISQTPRKLR